MARPFQLPFSQWKKIPRLQAKTLVVWRYYETRQGGPGAREAAGLPPNTGPYKIITDLAVLGFDEETKTMMVESIHQGVELDRVKEATGFELIIPDFVPTTPPPSDAELRILRGEVDPLRLVIGR